MPEQQLFLPFEAPQIRRIQPQRFVERDRLFFAVLSPRDAAREITERIRHLRIEHGLKGRPIAPARLHISLHGLGDYFQLPGAVIASAREAGDSVAMPPFEIVFDRVLSFRKNRAGCPLVLRPGGDVPALASLHRLLGDAMKRAGLSGGRARRFTPHMTLLYDDCAVKEQAIEPIGMPVADFALVHSLVGQSRYIELARWRLRG
jgi:2'-5' RNA ligase